MPIFQCFNCHEYFHRDKRSTWGNRQNNHNLHCSRDCSFITRQKKGLVHTYCRWCGTFVSKQVNQIAKSKSGYIFCGRSCSAKYNNAYKTRGIRRSKLEEYIEHQLKSSYPQLSLIFNSKTVINSELDIYIPELKIAFELNGIFHYEPIYGQDKLNSIQSNDDRKFQACLERGIELCIIDTSHQKRFTEKGSIKYLSIIKSIIDMKIK